MRKKVFILGHLGLFDNPYDGQTSKTRNVFELLNSKVNDIGGLRSFDTQKLRNSFLSPFEMFYNLLRCNTLVYVPAHNNLKFLFPIIYLICKLCKIKILYIVVGGWLDEYLQNKKLHVSLLSKIQGIFPQTNQLSDKLRLHYNFKNVIYFPNFRIHSFVPTFVANSGSFKIVFMARISRSKGIDTIFELARFIENKYGKGNTFIIDFYGRILKEDHDYFMTEIEKFEFVSYKGILEPEQIYSKLNEYDLMVLPTRYEGEGFPGTILDAYISGIPVVVSDWKYLSEFVDHGQSGYLFDLKKTNEFYYYVDKLYHDRDLLIQMKKYAYEKSKNYSSEEAWNIIKIFVQIKNELPRGNP